LSDKDEKEGAVFVPGKPFQAGLIFIRPKPTSRRERDKRCSLFFYFINEKEAK